MKNLKLKRTVTTTYAAAAKAETETVTEAKPQTLPPQPPEMDQSFGYKMKQRIQQKEAKYQNMMANAF